MRIIIISIATLMIVSCASTGTKNISELQADSSNQANLWFKRDAGWILGGVRTIVKIDGNKVGSLYPRDYDKFFVNPGYRTISTQCGPLECFGKTTHSLELEAGKSYYFITGVNVDQGLGIALAGMLGSAVAGGPFPFQQVTEEAFLGFDYEASAQ